MAEDDDVDILGDFDGGDLVENNPDVPTFTEIGIAHCEDGLLSAVAQETWLLAENTVNTLKPGVELVSEESQIQPKPRAPQKTPTVRNRKQPWSPEERALFHKGMALYGRRWTKIARLIGTRTTLQVKNYATHYFKMLVKSQTGINKNINNGHLHAAKSPPWEASASSKLAETSLSNTLTCVQHDVENENDEVDVDVLGDDQRLSNHPAYIQDANRSPENVFSEADCIADVARLFGAALRELPLSDSDSRNDFGIPSFDVTQQVPDLTKTNHVTLTSLPASSEVETLLPCVPVSTSLVDNTCFEDPCPAADVNTTKDMDEAQDNGALDSNHPELVCDPPTHEIVVDHSAVMEEEKEFHREFFEGRFPKTPERYLKIRNYILDMWEKSKPSYLNKTCVRSGLKNCGDVNSIGRIHAYLEMKGAINFGCGQAVYNRPATLTSVCAKTSKANITGNLKEIVCSRKRKSPYDLPVFESGQGGVTIEHTDDGDKVVMCPEARAVVKTRANPFRLIPCTTFCPESAAPYSVVIHAEAVVIMDIHAHTSNTEVIGLLGGFYNSELQQLEIVIAKPCHSLSTGRQCEMDPVSQTEASQALEALGLAVVGWYHSHPTFLPHPSLRDLETQAKYQEWFGQHRNPFVAVIVSPYSGPLVSKMLCMIVGEAAEDANHRQPFQLTTAFSGTSFRPEHCLEKVVTLLRDFVEETTAVAMDTAFAAKPEYTLLKKMLASVESHLAKAEVFSCSEFMDSLKQLMSGKETLLATFGDEQL